MYLAGKCLIDSYYALTRLRLRWYIRTSGDLVLRHWQWFLIIGMIIPNPPVIGLFVVPASLLEAIIAGGHSWLAQVVAVLVVQLVALLWIVPQRQLLAGGIFMTYAATLPLPKWLCLAVDLTLLAVANCVILIPVLFATGHALAMRDCAYQLCVLWTLLGSTLVAQLSALKRRAIVLPLLGVADVFLGWSLASPPGALRWLLFVPTLAGAVAAPFLMDRIKPPSLAPGFSQVQRISLVLSRHAPSCLVQCKAIAAKPGLTTFRLSTTFAVALGVDRLIAIFQFDQRSLPTDILAMAIIALILSGLYRVLRDAHASMQGYLTALPSPQHYWPLRDTIFVFLLGAAPLCILLTPLLLHGLASVFVVFALMVAYQALLALLRLPLVFGGRRAVLYGFLMAAAWSGAAMAAVAR